jgi:hypothetical protein
VQGVGHHQLHVVHPPAGRHLQDLFDDPSPDVGGLHGREGDGDVVERDGEAHAGTEEIGKGLAVVGVHQGVADRPLHVADAGQGIGRIDHPRPEGEALEPEPLTLVHQERRSPLVHLQHESRSGHPASL